LIGTLRASGDIATVELKGMEKLGLMLKQLETVADADIDAEIRRYFRLK